ncbi:MAG TPA: TIM-barrel domain-containing protein [Chitinispirillaceae bacterium]|nr:TIM-barrel domain-containing protein [Chitinispirillaceae bacterium]
MKCLKNPRWRPSKKGFWGLMMVQLSVSLAVGQIGDYASHAKSGSSIVITGGSGEKMRITPYGDYMVRVQAVKSNETFYPDTQYEMVERHDWSGELAVEDNSTDLQISTKAADGVVLSVAKTPMRISFSLKAGSGTLLKEKDGVVWSGNTVTESFTSTTDEHFAGLGHEKYGRVPKLDRTGTSLKVSAGSEGACIVPFFISSKGYGILLNTTFTHTIALCADGVYSLSINGEGYGGKMDYFFIAGPLLTQVIDRYTQLTGRPRLPQKSIFGLHLSDKSDPSNPGESWWKDMINKHRNAGFAVDHQVNDNAWRKSNEAVSTQQNSWFEFNNKYDPPEYKKWCDANGITVTLDLNRPNIPKCWGWDQSKYGIPNSTACPDFTNPAARKWIWDLFYNKAFDPSLGYPGDAIWLDEFDYPDHNHSTTLKSGKRWAEEAINYHFNLLKACVKEGWDPAIGEAKRSYFWSRGITAGAQRFGFYWSGDIDGNYNDMKYQVKAMQSAGICGFPFFNHDAGGHVNLTINNDNCYRQWDMAFGSFTPIWKPHGPSHTRWPLQRTTTCQATAKTFITARYQMLPYIYTYAYKAWSTGVPMVRSMFLEDQNNATAWQKELQYFWGKEMLIAPNCSDGNNNVSVWFPKGNWYDFWNDKKYTGDQTINYSAATGVLPAFVREGAVIPMVPFAKSTFFITKDTLIIHVYTGADGVFQLYEDDGVTEKYRTKNEFRLTGIKYSESSLRVDIGAAEGQFSNASSKRTYQIVYHGLSAAQKIYLSREEIKSYTKESDIPANQNGTVWDSEKKLLTVRVAAVPVNENVMVSNDPTVNVISGKKTCQINSIQLLNNTLMVRLSQPASVDVSIYKLNGCRILSPCQQQKDSKTHYEFSLRSSGMSKGIYMVKINAGGQQLVQQIVLR